MVLSLDTPAAPEVLERLGHGVDEVYFVGGSSRRERHPARQHDRRAVRELDQIGGGGADQHRPRVAPAFEPTMSSPAFGLGRSSTFAPSRLRAPRRSARRPCRPPRRRRRSTLLCRCRGRRSPPGHRSGERPAHSLRSAGTRGPSRPVRLARARVCPIHGVESGGRETARRALRGRGAARARRGVARKPRAPTVRRAQRLDPGRVARARGEGARERDRVRLRVPYYSGPRVPADLGGAAARGRAARGGNCPGGLRRPRQRLGRVDRRRRRGGRHGRRAEPASALASRLGAKVEDRPSPNAGLLVVGSKAAQPGVPAPISAASAYLVELTHCPAIVLPRGVPLPFQMNSSTK